jgi:uroporphyrinogen-III synthase
MAALGGLSWLVAGLFLVLTSRNAVEAFVTRGARGNQFRHDTILFAAIGAKHPNANSNENETQGRIT